MPTFHWSRQVMGQGQQQWGWNTLMEKGHGEERIFPECTVVFHNTTIHPLFLTSLFLIGPSTNLKCIPATLALSRLTRYMYLLSQIELLTLLSSQFQKQESRKKNRASLSQDANNILGNSIFHPSLQCL